MQRGDVHADDQRTGRDVREDPHGLARHTHRGRFDESEAHALLADEAAAIGGRLARGAGLRAALAVVALPAATIRCLRAVVLGRRADAAPAGALAGAAVAIVDALRAQRSALADPRLAQSRAAVGIRLTQAACLVAVGTHAGRAHAATALLAALAVASGVGAHALPAVAQAAAARHRAAALAFQRAGDVRSPRAARPAGSAGSAGSAGTRIAARDRALVGGKSAAHAALGAGLGLRAAACARSAAAATCADEQRPESENDSDTVCHGLLPGAARKLEVAEKDPGWIEGRQREAHPPPRTPGPGADPIDFRRRFATR